ncbi:hypothetical protein QFZ55_002514 [Streptomyces luteogriseus]|uniref:phosphatase PAP2 family protein n=1 Tax=Streptomyces luteogriseus TaxID=68233 RepID=UPI00277E53A4|nr:phosphatase PAP2 family protein [Streptomyces luteogriseus]MDQ0713062.1 hypothetical protein [Streptomyces luteogriseus]
MTTTASRKASRTRRIALTARRHPRALLWVAAGVLTLGFLVALQIAAHHLGIQGPITAQAREVIHAPKSGFLLYASLALTMVVLTWRQRLIALGTAMGIDLVFLLVRWATGTYPDEGHPFGNGALWMILGLGVIALTRRTGPERVLMLKGVGLGLLLVTGRKTGDTWLLITSKTRPLILDPYVAMADHALGNPSWLAGRLLRASGPVGEHALDYVYAQLAVAAVCVALYQLRNVAAERRFPRHHLVRTFLLIGLLGPAFYMIYPVVGPMFAYGPEGGHWAAANLWPDTLPPVITPYAMPFDEITPRNCMPSLHTAWATTIFIHSRKGPRALRYAGTFWLVATLAATLGFGWHYGVDLVAGVVFAYTVETGLRTYDRGWDRAGLRLIGYGTVVFAVLLASYRFVPLEMAAYPWMSGPLLLLAMASVVYGYRRTTRLWEAEPAPARPEPQPELAV